MYILSGQPGNVIQMKIVGLLFLVSGVYSDVVSVIEGDSVTLHTGVETNQDRIRWYFNDTRIAQITGDQSKICTDVQCKERFRNRLKLDHQTGSLTIMNITTTDSGIYLLKIFSTRIEKVFIVNVTVLHKENPTKTKPGLCAAGIIFAIAAVTLCCIKHLYRKPKIYRDTKAKEETILVMDRDSVTLNTDVIEILRDDEIIWHFGAEDDLIAKIRDWKKEIHDGPDGRFRDRLKLDPQTGSLIITDTRTTDSGDYKLQINSNGKTSFKRFNVSFL